MKGDVGEGEGEVGEEEVSDGEVNEGEVDFTHHINTTLPIESRYPSVFLKSIGLSGELNEANWHKACGLPSLFL